MLAALRRGFCGGKIDAARKSACLAEYRFAVFVKGAPPSGRQSKNARDAKGCATGVVFFLALRGISFFFFSKPESVVGIQ